MTRILILGTLLLALSAFLAIGGCDKEKIVESTEYVHDIEYVQLPGDTITIIDTVFSHDSIHQVDTVFMHDTVVQQQYVYDTITVFDIDTVTLTQSLPNEFTALGALQYYCDPLVLEFINAEFGISDGWIFYLSAFQLDLTKQSASVYDIYGYIDYWTTDWSGYYPLEYYWRVSFTGGDPADPDNWQLSDPPSKASGHNPGVSLTQDRTAMQSINR